MFVPGGAEFAQLRRVFLSPSKRWIRKHTRDVTGSKRWSLGETDIEPVHVEDTPMSVSVHNHVHLRNTSHPFVNVGTEDIPLSEFP